MVFEFLAYGIRRKGNINNFVAHRLMYTAAKERRRPPTNTPRATPIATTMRISAAINPRIKNQAHAYTIGVTYCMEIHHC
jgi:hypothetical protein